MINIRIKMFGQFTVLVDGDREDLSIVRSRKGAALIKYLILNRGDMVTRKRLFEALWPDESVGNPENALKTLVSRTRSIMESVCPGFSDCLSARRGGYAWNETEGVTVDMYEAESMLDELNETDGPDAVKAEQLLEIYKGKLLESEQYSWVLPYSAAIHNKFMNVVCRYIESLNGAYKYEETVRVCRRVLQVDEFEDKVHIALMTALLKLKRENEALRQYRRVKQLHYEYLGVSLSADLQAFYKNIVVSGNMPVLDLNDLRRELYDPESSGHVICCEYAVFKEVYNLELSNPSHGAYKMLAVIRLDWSDRANVDPALLDEAMNYLMKMLEVQLKRGDIFTRFSTSVVAMLLFPYENFSYTLLMEEIKHRFYTKYLKSGLVFEYQVGTVAEKHDARKK